jgi:MinD-like ATPase involved in chromosome partitioning or flagellar assembly
MARIISIHSFRGGTGKSNTTANIAAILAGEGRRVGVIDTDIQSPGIHVLFGLKGNEITHSLNDFLWRDVAIDSVAEDVTSILGENVYNGRLFLIPSSIQPGEITRVLREGYDAKMLTKGLRSLLVSLNLDVLLIDTHPGLNEETLLSLVISHSLAIIMRPDQQDYEGTGVTVAVGRKLNVPHMMLVVNKAPQSFDAARIKADVEASYQCPVAAVLPHFDEMMILGSANIFSLEYPDHPLTDLYRQVATKLME